MSLGREEARFDPAAQRRAEYDCRLRAAVLLLEPDLPEALARDLPDLVFASARAARLADVAEPMSPEWEPAVGSAYRGLSRALAHRDILRAIQSRAART